MFQFEKLTELVAYLEQNWCIAMTCIGLLVDWSSTVTDAQAKETSSDSCEEIGTDRPRPKELRLG